MLLRRSLIVVAVLLVALLLLAACAEETTTTTTTTTTKPVTTTTTTLAGPGQYGGVFRLLGANQCLSFGWPPNSGANYICQLPCEELLAYQTRDNVNEPLLATNWELAPDGSYFTIHLRQGIKFHDGSDLNAEVVKFNMDYWMAEGTRNDWGSVEVVDDYTVRINFNKAYRNTFIDDALLIAIASQVSAEKNGLDWAMVNGVGTGPFKFVSYERDAKVVFARNDDYWQEGLPYLDGVEVIYVRDPLTASLAMQAGEGDALGAVTGDKLSADLVAAGLNFVNEDNATAALFPDGLNPDSPYYDKRVRQAVEYAIDKEALAAATGFGFSRAAYQCPYKGQVGYDPDFVGRLYNPDKARQLLEDAGYPNGFETTIYPSPGNMGLTSDDALIIQGYLAEVGIEAEIDVIDFPRWVELAEGGWHNGLFPYTAPGTMFSNPNRDMNVMFGPHPFFMVSTYSSPEFLALLAESSASAQPDAELLKAVFQYIRDEAMVIPIHSLVRGFFVQDYVHDTGFMTGSSGGLWTPETLWIEQ